VAHRPREQRADQVRRRQAHLLIRLVDEQLHQVQLVGWQKRRTLCQSECNFIEHLSRDRL
jgi:hypothetical protein